MTPLIRETIAWTTTTGMDPTELQWFDISGLTADQMAVNTDALMTCRPPRLDAALWHRVGRASRTLPTTSWPWWLATIRTKAST